MTITLEIIDPIPGKGRNRNHEVVKTDPPHKEDYENYYIELACIVRVDGVEVKDKTVTVSSNRDASQNKTLVGTGVIHPIIENEVKRKIPIYAYHYEFKQPGNHKITFTCETVSTEVDIVVQP